MQNTEPYAPVLVSLTWPLTGLAICFLLIAGPILWRLSKKRHTGAKHRRQKRLEKAADDDFIVEALSHARSVKKELQDNDIEPGIAAEELSGIVRLVVDKISGQRTLYRSRDEVAELRLEQLASIMGTAYPQEFNRSLSSNEQCLQLCDEIIEVIESCR